MGNIDEETKKTTVFHQKTLKWKLGNEKNITLPKEAAGNRGTHRMGSPKVGLAVSSTVLRREPRTRV